MGRAGNLRKGRKRELQEVGKENKMKRKKRERKVLVKGSMERGENDKSIRNYFKLFYYLTDFVCTSISGLLL